MLTILIPYFSGDSSAANSQKGNRLRYLRKTLENARTLSRDILVGVCTKADRGVDPRTVLLDCDPIHLATTLCSFAQKQVAGDFFYVTEADQIAHYTTTDILNVVEGDTYLIPHRLEQVWEHEQTGMLVGSDRGTVIRFRGQLYVLPNGAPETWGAEGFYEPVKRHERFGGAYLATEGLFRKVDFSPGETYPVEQATGFRIAETGVPLKTGMWRDFFVEHLSGVEYHRSLLVEAA